MKKYIYKLICIIMILVIILSKEVRTNSEINKTVNDENKPIRVGFYDCYPYYFINSNLEYDGYYNELMQLLATELNVEYENVPLNIENAFRKLANNEIDLLFGINVTAEREQNYIFSKYHISTEYMSIYTKKDIDFGNVKALNGKTVGTVKYQYGSREVINKINTKNMNLKVVEKNSFDELIYNLKEGRLDAIIHISDNDQLNDYREIYKFSTGPVFIVTSKQNAELMNKIDTLFDSHIINGSINKLHSKYFNKDETLYRNITEIFGIMMLIIITIIIYLTYKKYTINKREKIIRSKVEDNLIHKNFFLVYQPIIDPKKNTIKGFEALLRLDENGEVIPPSSFLKDIQEVKMLDQVSIWILSQALKEYLIIREYRCVNKEEFYISINISYEEIENDKFIQAIKEIILHSNLPAKCICLEIVENIAINDLQKVQKVISNLREVGFMVAIDDFGVEYSNLDILEKIDCDVVKLDKYFIDEVEHSNIRREVVRFVSSICKITNKVVVCEGVENAEQKKIIKNMENEKIYIQGYFYSKPLTLEQLRNYNIKYKE